MENTCSVLVPVGSLGIVGNAAEATFSAPVRGSLSHSETGTLLMEDSPDLIWRNGSCQ